MSCGGDFSCGVDCVGGVVNLALLGGDGIGCSRILERSGVVKDRALVTKNSGISGGWPIGLVLVPLGESQGELKCRILEAEEDEDEEENEEFL